MARFMEDLIGAITDKIKCLASSFVYFLIGFVAVMMIMYGITWIVGHWI